MRSGRFRPTLLLTILVLCSLPSNAQESSYILFGGGSFNISGSQDAAQLDIEWRSTPKAWKLQINAGGMVTSDNAAYVFGGLRRDLRAGENWGISLGFGVGLWETGDGLDLGGLVEFRSSIELFAEVTDRSRLGLMFYHLSHAGIYEENPGSNSLVLLYGRRLK